MKPIKLRDKLLPGTTLLPLPGLEKLRVGADTAVAYRQIITVEGPTGSGKTTALAALAEQWTQGPVHYAPLDPNQNDRTVMAAVYEAVTGRVPADRFSRWNIHDDLRTKLAGTEGRLLIVDEAQNARTSALEMLRSLHDDPTNRWGLVLSGMDLEAHIAATSKALISRVGLRTRFPTLELEDIPAVLAKLHPLYAMMSVPFIERAYNRAAHGELRQWAHLLVWLLKFTDQGRLPVTLEILDAAVAMLLGE